MEEAVPKQYLIRKDENEIKGIKIKPFKKIPFQNSNSNSNAKFIKNQNNIIPPRGTEKIDPSHYSLFPYRIVGKVFAIDSRGRKYGCSAALAGDKVVMTAAHCVLDAGQTRFSTDWTFIPQFRDGEAPFGQFKANKFSIWSTWSTYGSWSVDYAFVTFDYNLKSRLNGSLNVMVNGGKRYQYACGYPYEIRMNNGKNYDVDGGSLYCTYNPARIVKGPSQSIPSKLGEGSSGGPWITDLHINDINDNKNNINGVNSHVFPGKELMFSPYLNDDTAELYENAKKK